MSRLVSSKQQEAAGSVIELAKVVPMPRINYFQPRVTKASGFIFSQSASKLAVPQPHSDTELRHVPSLVKRDKPGTTRNAHPKTAHAVSSLTLGREEEESWTVAEEFSPQEYHIATLRRLPRASLIANFGLMNLFSRKRSGTIIKGDDPEQRVMRERSSDQIVPVSVAIASAEACYASTPPPRKSAGTVRGCRPSMFATRNSDTLTEGVTAYSVMMAIKREQELREQFAMLQTKGPHKFSSTPQAQPKKYGGATGTQNEQSECAETFGDEVGALKTARPDGRDSCANAQLV